MSKAAYLPIVADRYGALVRHLLVEGLDLTGTAMRAQVRLDGDTPGAPLVDLPTVTNGNQEGLRLVEVTTVDGLPTSHVEIVINETTMERLPYAGEIGDATQLRWDMQITIAGRKRRLARGEFEITGDGVTGADAAPLNRPQGYGRPRLPVANPWSAARLTFGEEKVTVKIVDAELVAPLVAQAKGFRDEADALVDQGEAAANRSDRSADAAELAASAAAGFVGGVLYPTPASGLAATAANAFFTVAGDGTNTFAILYQKVSGAAVEKARYISAPAVLDIVNRPNRISIKQFNPVGDGVADDTAALAAAINAAKAVGNGVVLSLEGLRLRHGDMSFTDLNNMVIDGMGAQLIPKGQALDEWYAVGFDNLTITRCHFKQTAGFNYNPPIQLINGRGLLIEDCKFDGVGFGIYVYGGNNVTFRRNTFLQVGIHPRPAPLDPTDAGYGDAFSYYGSGIQAISCDHVQFVRNYFKNDAPAGGHVTDRTGGGGAFCSFNSNDVTFDGNVSINAPGQGHLAAGEWSGTNIVNAYLNGTVSYTGRGRGIRFLGGYAEGSNQEGFTAFGVDNVQFVGCQAKDNRFASFEVWESGNVVGSGCIADERGMAIAGQIANDTAAIHITASFKVQWSSPKVLGARSNGVRVNGSYDVSLIDPNISNYGDQDSASADSASGIMLNTYSGHSPQLMADQTRITGARFSRKAKSGGRNTGSDIYNASLAGVTFVEGLTAEGRSVTYGGLTASLVGAPAKYISAGLTVGGAIDRPIGRVFSPERALHIGISAGPILQMVPIVAGQRDGYLVLVTGAMDDDPDKTFADLVLVVNGGAAKKIGDGDQAGGPAGRTYSVSGGYLLLAMSAGVASVCCTVIQTRSGSQFL